MSIEMKELGQIVKISKGKKYEETSFRNHKFRYINIDDLHEGGYLRYTNDDGVIVEENDVLIAWDGANAGKVGVGFSGVIGSTLARLRLLDNSIDANYLFRYLDSKVDLIKSQRTGATIPHVNGDSLRKLSIPLLPLPTQQHIANILDKADTLRKKDIQLLQHYDALAQSLFIDMFGDPVKNEMGWEMKTLGNSIAFLTSGSRGWAKYYDMKGDIFLRINNIGNNELKLDDLIFVNAPLTAEGKRTEVKFGDILMSITADIGRTAVIPINFPKAYINQHLALIRLKPLNNPLFVSVVLASDLGKVQLNKGIKGGVKSGINFDDIRAIELISPPIELQNQFAIQIQNIEQQKEKVKAQMQASEQLFQALLQKAFSQS